MSLILKTTEASPINHGKLYRDAMVTANTHLLIDTKNTHCRPNQGVPSSGDIGKDLSPRDLNLTYSGAGYDDLSGSDGISFQQGVASGITVGQASDWDMSGATSLCLSMWVARAAGFNGSGNQFLAGTTSGGTTAGASLYSALRTNGNFLWFVLNSAEGSMISKSAVAPNIIADTVQHHAMIWETDGTDSFIKQYVDGVKISDETRLGRGNLIQQTTHDFRIGFGPGVDAGFRFYRMNLELGDLANVGHSVTGETLEERMQKEHSINKDRFQF